MFEHLQIIPANDPSGRIETSEAARLLGLVGFLHLLRLLGLLHLLEPLPLPTVLPGDQASVHKCQMHMLSREQPC